MPACGVQVLHCFHVMGAGDSALIPFGQALRGRLLGMSESELLALEPEHHMEGIVFRALAAPARGLPDEARAVTGSRLEEDIVEAHAIDSVGEVLGGGNPEPSSSGRGDGRWRFAALSNFQRDVWRSADTVRAGGQRDRGNLHGSCDRARKHDQAADGRDERILAIQAG